jgi:hypothetical protein
VTTRLRGVCCLRCEFGVHCDVIMCWGVFDMGLGLPPSDVRPLSAPSEVHYYKFYLWGQVWYLPVSALLIRTYLPIFLGRSPVRRRPDKMGLMVLGLIMRVLDLPQPESPVS